MTGDRAVAKEIMDIVVQIPRNPFKFDFFLKRGKILILNLVKSNQTFMDRLQFSKSSTSVVLKEEFVPYLPHVVCSLNRLLIEPHEDIIIFNGKEGWSKYGTFINHLS